MPKMVTARMHDSNMIYTTAPDVCLTPMGSSIVPVPYSSMVTLGNSYDVTKSVKQNGCEDFQLNSRAKGVTGHEPGSKKGVVTPGYTGGGEGFVKKASGSNATGGFAVARDGDPAWINRPDHGGKEPQSSPAKEEVKHIP